MGKAGEWFTGQGKAPQATDVTSDWAKKNGRDLNSERSNAFYNMLTGNANNPMANSLRTSASATADAAISPFATSMQEYANQQSIAGRRSMEQRLSQGGMLGTDSGAGRYALMKAAQDPWAAAQAQISGKYSDIYSSAYEKLLGNLAGQSEQALVAPQFANATDYMGATIGALGDVGAAMLGK